MPNETEPILKVPPIDSLAVVGMIYEKFRPFTKMCGPLYAGDATVAGKGGVLYLTEMQYWLWSCDDSSESKELTHPEVDRLTTPQRLLRSLLESAKGKLKIAENHLDRIEQRAEDISSMLGYYLAKDAEAMTDIFATQSFFTLESPEQWKRIKKASQSERF